MTLAQVHDTLSYFYDHIEQIIADIRAGEVLVSELRKLRPGVSAHHTQVEV